LSGFRNSRKSMTGIPFHIVLLIYNVFDAGIFGGKLHARRYGCNRCNEISSTWMTCDSGKYFRPRFGSNGSGLAITVLFGARVRADFACKICHDIRNTFFLLISRNCRRHQQ
jgi:hypothetical protein